MEANKEAEALDSYRDFHDRLSDTAENPDISPAGKLKNMIKILAEMSVHPALQ